METHPVCDMKVDPKTSLQHVHEARAYYFCAPSCQRAFAKGCRKSEIARSLLAGDTRRARHAAERFAAIFGPGNFFLELQRHHERGDRRLNHGLAWRGQTLDLPLVATGNVHYLTPDQARLHDLLTCIRHRVPLEQAGDLLRPNAEYTLRTPAEMAALFAAWPEALRATLGLPHAARHGYLAAHKSCPSCHSPPVCRPSPVYGDYAKKHDRTEFPRNIPAAPTRPCDFLLLTDRRGRAML